MSGTLEVASSIDEGVDRKTLKTLNKRFLKVNNERLARARLGLGPRAQQFLDLLPLLFHCNHPMLPGYVSRLCPHGVVGYRPGKLDIARAQRLVRSFTWSRPTIPEQDIHAIYLMGSCGTVGQTERSDLDIWVCHGPGLDNELERLLQQKCDAISLWAQQQLHLEAHCFVMEGEKFRRGERAALSAEDCGTSQHYLLLDEFYRTGLLLAGKAPIWWLVPTSEENHYNYNAETLRRKRFVGAAETLDFGSVAHIPAGEFVGAGIWQMYKAIESPYKSVLKLLLTEVYASEYPRIEPLSHTYKRAIYDNRLDIDELDPYVMVYRRLEQYLLSRGEPERVELVRRCFYFKVGKALSRSPASRSKSWQRLLMEKLVAEWGWDQRQLQQLDSRPRWKAGRVMEEQGALVLELTRGYRYLQEFARHSQATASISSQEMALLGRKLYAAFERKAGKVEWVNPGIAPDLTEELLTFAQPQPGRGWSLYTDPDLSRDPGDSRGRTPLKRERDLVALLVWCVLNGLIGRGTRLQLCNDVQAIGETELVQIARTLSWLRDIPADQYTDQDRYARANQPQVIQLFINVGVDPLAQTRGRGMERLSSHTDSFGYSGMKENLALTVDWVQRNSWGDVATRAFRGPHALLDCVRDYLTLLPPGRQSGLPRLDIRCFSPSRASAIAGRVEELFRDLAACFYSGTRPPASRYILEVERSFYLIQGSERGPLIDHAPDQAALFELLSRPQTGISPLVLDRHCQPGSPLSAIAQCARTGMLSVFYRRQGDRAEVFVVDERGSLYRMDSAFHDERSLLYPLDRFLRATLFRRTGEDSSDLSGHDLAAAIPAGTEIRYYELVEEASGVQAEARAPALHTAGSDFHVQAIASHAVAGEAGFDIYCGELAFTELDWGDALYATVARHILACRRSAERYPCYITDLDLSRHAQGVDQTSLYLHYKERLEAELNRALAAL